MRPIQTVLLAGGAGDALRTDPGAIGAEFQAKLVVGGAEVTIAAARHRVRYQRLHLCRCRDGKNKEIDVWELAACGIVAGWACAENTFFQEIVSA